MCIFIHSFIHSSITIHQISYLQPCNAPNSLPKLPLPFDDHHQNLIRQYKAPPQPPSPTASRFTQPFCQDAECGPTDRPLRCIVERCETLHCDALRKRRGSLVADHWKASKPLRFTTTHCSASSARCSGVHHTRDSFRAYNNGGTLRKRYRKLRDHWNACGPL